MPKEIVILGIESSCDETSAAVIKDGVLLSNVVADQQIHKIYGGVVPELASREHQKNIIPVVSRALELAGIGLRAPLKTKKFEADDPDSYRDEKAQLTIVNEHFEGEVQRRNSKFLEVPLNAVSAVAVTCGPGLLGSLMVGVSFAKGIAIALDKPLISVHHMLAHTLSPFIIKKEDVESGRKTNIPSFPFLCMNVSGGHTQIVKVVSPLCVEPVGQTLDDAAGECFDKSAYLLGFSYPGGPMIDKYSKGGDPFRFRFPMPSVPGYDFSFSGLKTAIFYFLQSEIQKNNHFIEDNKADLCASIQATIVFILLGKLKAAASDMKMNEIAIAGGVAANSFLRHELISISVKQNWKIYYPEMEFCTDNAAMIALAGYYKYLSGSFSTQSITPLARMKFEMEIH